MFYASKFNSDISTWDISNRWGYKRTIWLVFIKINKGLEL